MNTEQIIAAQLEHTIEGTNFTGLGELYRGKVRDVYRTDERLVIVTTDRVSAFDHVLGTIPFKGQILNRIAALGFEQTADIAPNHVISVPDPNVLIAKPAKPYPVEFVVRGYITGSLWRDYETGKAGAYGLSFANDLVKDQKFDAPILTPSTKAELGAHDEPISKAEIVRRGMMTQAQLDEAEALAIALFLRGSELARARGLILVDTKYEFGRDRDDKFIVIDEIHTPDSSRYWVADSYETLFAQRKSQQMLDKENLRQWLIDTHGFTGNGTPPALDADIRIELSKKYMDLFSRVTGRAFDPIVGEPVERMRACLKAEGLLR